MGGKHDVYFVKSQSESILHVKFYANDALYEAYNTFSRVALNLMAAVKVTHYFYMHREGFRKLAFHFLSPILEYLKVTQDSDGVLNYKRFNTRCKHVNIVTYQGVVGRRE